MNGKFFLVALAFSRPCQHHHLCHRRLNCIRKSGVSIRSFFRSKPMPSCRRSPRRRGGLIVNCVGQPGRIDFNLTAAPSQAPQTTVALIDRPIELRDELTRIINFLGGSFVLDHISRVALFLQFLNPKPNYAEANKALTELIPDQYGVTITDEQDFVFQINQPHMNEEFQDITMNFITKWSVERFQILTLALPLGGVPAEEVMSWGPPQLKTVIAASVVFDNNNFPPTPVRALTSKEQSVLLQKALDAGVRKQLELGLNIEGF